MPSIIKEGKDTIIFASKEDHADPSNVELPPPEPSSLLVTSDGKINWGCPCLGGMATGPCGLEFREAFSCFHFSTADPKGSDCYEAFKTMQVCMMQYPTLYESKGSMDDIMDEEDDKEEMVKQSASADSENKRNAVAAIQDDVKRNEETVNVSSTKQEVEQAKTN